MAMTRVGAAAVVYTPAAGARFLRHGGYSITISNAMLCRSTATNKHVEPPNLVQLCEKSRLSLTAREIEEFSPKIAKVVDWFSQLQDVDVENIDPAIRAGDVDGSSSMRPDTPSVFEDREAMLAGAPESEGPYLKVPKILNEKIDWVEVIFKLKKNETLWTVPWTGQTIFQVMLLWFAAFWLMGSWVIPFTAETVGLSKHTLSFRGQALYSLITDIAEGTMGLCILQICLARFRPLPSGWFPVHWQGKWFVEACLGSMLFPIVNRLSQLNLELLPLPSPINSTQLEQSMMSKDPVATLLYALVISVCAPIWEEVIFRGFLLPSLTRYFSLWGAVLVSSVAFALAHFSMQRMLPLTFLGLVMGLVFVRSRNLLASILLHSLWNGFAFLELLR